MKDASELPPQRSAPPWIGPLATREDYDRQWLGVCLAMLLAATFFFGWRGLFLVLGTACLASVVFAIAAVPLRLVREEGRFAHPPFLYALNMGLLTGLTLPILPTNWIAVVAAVLVGLLSHMVGPTCRLRVHPVAGAQLLLVLAIPFLGQVEGPQAVLAPGSIVLGDVLREGPPRGGPLWFDMEASPSAEALERPAPHRLMRREQHRLLERGSRLATLLKEGRLARLPDILFGGVPGPVGATSALLLIVLGMHLMVQRIGRYPVALLAGAAALVVLAILPVAMPGGVVLSCQRFADAGWRVVVAYLSYQLLATPLPLIVLILAPLTTPRTSAGRAVYAVLLGGGVVVARWFIPYEWSAYLPLALAGAMAPMLDRLRNSPFIRQGGE